MRTVITISLNGNAYQIDAVGFDALRAYLQVAEQRLAGNPDQEEILADLEQAIADKCLRYLAPHKNVVSAGEITEVLREMGPVDGGVSEGQAQPGAAGVGAGGVGAAGARGGAGPSAGATASSSSWAGGNGDAWSGSGAGIGGGTSGAGGAAGIGAGLGAAGNEDSWTAGATGTHAGTGPDGAPGVGGRPDTAGADIGSGAGATYDAGAGASSGPGSSTWSTGTAGASGTPGTNTPPLRRLYLIREGAAIAGVCKGLAAYLNLDVSIVRILFIVLTILTGGVWILIYLVMMFVIPYAQTSEQHAAAHGWPFNAEELIARAKAHYAEFKNSSKWQRQQWRAQQRTWKSQNKQWKQQRRDWERYGSAQGFPPPPPPPPWSSVQPPPNTSYANQILTGVFGPLADLIGVVLFIAFLLALFALLTHHRFLGMPLPIEVPSWMGIIILIVVYQAIIAPLRRARYSAHYGVPFANGWWAVFGALIWIVFVLAIGYQVYLHWWQITDFLQSFTSALHDVISPWHEALERKAASGV